jgi:plasmid replication initiation protein
MIVSLESSAVEALDEKDEWFIEWKPITAGRKVKALHFTFKRNPQHHYRLSD